MGVARGVATALGMYDETAYNTAPGTPDGVKLYHTGFGVSANRENDEINSLAGYTEDKPLPGAIDVSGSLPVKCCAKSAGKLFKHALGTVNTTGTNPYTHVITIGALPAGFRLEPDYGADISDSGRYEQFGGCRIAGMSLEAGGNKHPSISFDIKGASSTLASAPLDATYTDSGCSPFALAEMSMLEGGASISTILSLSAKLAREFSEDEYAIGGLGVRGSLTEGKVKITGEITAVFDSMALLNKAIASTESSLKVVLSRGTGLGSAGNEYMEWLFNTLVYGRRSAAVEGPAGLRVKLPFTAYGSQALQVTLKNAVATL